MLEFDKGARDANILSDDRFYALGSWILLLTIWQEHTMSAQEIADRHFTAAIAEAEANGLGVDSVCRSLLGLVVSQYLATRGVEDVQSELRFVADNCDPDTDFMFMRP
jgi:hypothetical protein